MAKLKSFNGRYCEWKFEKAFITYLEDEGWQYLPGSSILRDSQRDVLYVDDMEQFLRKTNPELSAEEIMQIIDSIRLAGAEGEFATLHKVYNWMVDGVRYVPENGETVNIALIDYDNYKNNIFRVVNQFVVEYTNNGQVQNRRPDLLLYVNGIPLCIIELKNPADAHAKIYDAWEQIYYRYWRDIPHLLHFCPLACISDGVNTRLGTVRTPYEHFYAWRRVNDGDKVSSLPFDEVQSMIKGVYSPERFLEIFRDYIYFQDSKYDSDEREIVCRYPQFFAARLLKQSIIKSVKEKSGKGGTYFGATGCGKTYTMAFLSRQLALRCTDIPEIGSPTIVMIVDREELQKQGAKLFTKSEEFLNLGEVKVVSTRKDLRQELGARQSGGFYICTIQKFCDREDDKIGLINDRNNIICFSDEAHRTQLEHSKKIQFSKDADDNMKAMVSKPYAKVLREAFPCATFVGFTGTPIAETYQTFGDEIDRYTMDQAVADGLTVSIKYHPRIAKVLLDEKQVQLIEEYYKKCADSGATKEDIEASKKAMSSMEKILDEPERLERLAVDIHDHYVAACANDPDRVQKAMVVCSSRPIAYKLLKIFQDKYPEWFIEKKTPDGVTATAEELRELKEMPCILVCVVLTVATEGAGAPAAAAIFAASAKSGAIAAASSALIGGTAAGVITGIETEDFDESMKAAMLSGSEGLKWGAITGALTGGASEAIALKGATSGGLTMNQVAQIQKESKYPLDLIKQFKSMDEFNIYFNEAKLTTGMINGRTALLPKDTLNSKGFLNFKSKQPDGTEITNLQRMLNGNAPIDPATNKALQLHHIGQKADGTLAVLTESQHQGNSQILNRFY